MYIWFYFRYICSTDSAYTPFALLKNQIWKCEREKNAYRKGEGNNKTKKKINQQQFAICFDWFNFIIIWTVHSSSFRLLFNFLIS